MRAAEHVLRYLAKIGVKHLFGIPGGTVNPFYDAIGDVDGISPLIARHEAAAAYAAASYAKATGQVGVVAASSGPGSSNLLTGVASAMREGTPMLVLTGQVPSPKMGFGGAQEASPWTMDMVAAFKPFTKKSVMVGQGENLTESVRQAIRLALTPPCGPVHLALPMDVQMKDIGEPLIPEPLMGRAASYARESDVRLLVGLMGPSTVLFVGSGVKKARASQALLEIAERTGALVVTTPSSKGTIPETHPLSRGVYGLAGNAEAKAAVKDAKKLVVLGSSLGELATSNWAPELFQGKTVVQVDHDLSAIGARFQPDVAIQADLKCLFDQMIAITTPMKAPMRPVAAEDASKAAVPQHLLSLNALVPDETILCCDIGEHMTWALKHWKTKSFDGFDIAINYGGMGSGIANAIGMKLAHPDRPVLCLTGDGCFAMHGNEILTAIQYKIPLVMVVVNNSGYGMVKWGHWLQYSKYPEGLVHPHFSVSAMARAMGADAYRIASPHHWKAIDVKGLLESKRVTVIEVMDSGLEVPPMADRVSYLKGET